MNVDLIERTVGLSFKCCNKTPQIDAEIHPFAFSESLAAQSNKEGLFLGFAGCMGEHDSAFSLCKAWLLLWYCRL